MKPFSLRPHEARAGERLRMVVRVLKPQPPDWIYPNDRPGYSCMTPPGKIEFRGRYVDGDGYDHGPAAKFIPLPLKAGQSYWCRETYVIESDRDYSIRDGLPDDGRPIQTIDCPEWGRHHLIPHYRATDPDPHIVPPYADDDRTRWSSSQTMPQWASRYTMTVQDVRVCRVQEITEDEMALCGCPYGYPFVWFHDLWNATAKPGERYEDNPFVMAARVAVTARRNIDEER
jgi:hypothetical protein